MPLLNVGKKICPKDMNVNNQQNTTTMKHLVVSVRVADNVIGLGEVAEPELK